MTMLSPELSAHITVQFSAASCEIHQHLFWFFSAVCLLVLRHARVINDGHLRLLVNLAKSLKV